MRILPWQGTILPFLRRVSQCLQQFLANVVFYFQERQLYQGSSCRKEACEGRKGQRNDEVPNWTSVDIFKGKAITGYKGVKVNIVGLVEKLKTISEEELH